MEPTISTRVWWDDSEVSFIRWTEKALVFSWGNVTETAVHMPRGAVVRLLQKGVMKIEGEVPEWIQSPVDVAPIPDPESGVRTLMEPQSEAADTQPHVPLTELPALQPSMSHVEAKPESQNNRLGVIARLIRKLGGSPPERDVSRVPG